MTHDLVDLARGAALSAGDIILNADRDPAFEIKGSGDYVTDVDRACERQIEATLREGTPGIAVVGEEAVALGSRSDRYWLVDPLDGTTNFLHGFKAVGVRSEGSTATSSMATGIIPFFFSASFSGSIRDLPQASGCQTTAILVLP